MRSQPILIIGASRSGTSLLARILSSSGIFMGADVESNHESRSLQAVNRWLLVNASAGFESPERIDALLADPFMRSSVGRVLESHVEGRSAWRYWGIRLLRRPAIWGFKDPRTTFTLPLWLDRYPSARVVHLLRNGVDVAVSLRARRRRVEERWSEGDVAGYALVRQNRTVANLSAATLDSAFDHWQRYVTRAQEHVDQLGQAQALTLKYEDLVNAPGETVASLSDFLRHSVRCDPAVRLTNDRVEHFRSADDATTFAGSRRSDLAVYGY